MNDRTKYSPLLRRIYHQYMNYKKDFFSLQTSVIRKSLKCNNCSKTDGLFECYHCNQHLCIQCCNKHNKKVNLEREYLHEFNDNLYKKLIEKKLYLEKEKFNNIHSCYQWRIDLLNTINNIHSSIIQTINDEYEILNEQYDTFIEKEITNIIDEKNHLLPMNKSNIDKIMKSIESFSLNVNLPTFDINNKLSIEAYFHDNRRNTNIRLQRNDDNDIDIITDINLSKIKPKENNK